MPSVCESKANVFSFMNLSTVSHVFQDINLSNFFGTFQLFLRDFKSLEVQTSISKRCLFKTQDMMGNSVHLWSFLRSGPAGVDPLVSVCSTDGTMTVVTTLSSTWPSVQPDRTTLLDPSCGPKQTEGSRVMFEFKMDSCGTRNMVQKRF